MKIANSLATVGRRFAAGLDVSPMAVRLVVVSRRMSAAAPVQIEYATLAPLAPGAMAGAEIVDSPAVARALRDAFGSLPPACDARLTRCAMAVPDSVTLATRVPLSRLQSPHARVVSGAMSSGVALAALEPAVMIEAERIAGIERHALAVDWFVEAAPDGGEAVTIAATARQHLEARIECAAAAGITLTAVDGEPHAALRALRYAGRLELAPREPFAALWIGQEGVFGWRIVEGVIAGEVRYPAPEYDCLDEALRDLAESGPIDCALVGGELELLEGVSLSLADVGDVLGCTALPFECAALAACASLGTGDALREPAYAVALGLALRGVME